MGDLRCVIKISFEMFGKPHEVEMDVNYSPTGGEVDGVDQRVIDFFREAWKIENAKYQKIIQKAYDQAHKKELEDAERAQLARLKAKYEKK